jgi:uncharacterized protein GlcG (DUF336 family)
VTDYILTRRGAIGTIGVSGESPEQDVQFAKAGAAVAAYRRQD